MARDSVNNEKKEMTELINKHSKQLQSFVDESIDDMVKERRLMVENN